MSEERYEIDRKGRIIPVPPLDGCTGCAMIVVVPVMILLFLKLLSKIPVIGEIFRLFYELIVYLLKTIFIELPLMVVRTFWDSLPPIGQVVLIVIIVLPILIGIGIWIKRKIDKMN